MNIAICGSLAFTYQFAELKQELETMGHEVAIPFTSRRILAGELTLEEILSAKGTGAAANLKAGTDVIRRYYEVVKESDAILVANYEKKGIPGYIGGNTFLEMGFAHVLHKPIFLLHPLPDLPYRDEMESMRPIITDRNLKQFEQQIEVETA
ncbi:hypothetical protein HY374_02995 [Candidatus Berkelbacteria bacterium]|nr:hypothetical protein [Candidatus Berkelbacteria bacterium]